WRATRDPGPAKGLFGWVVRAFAFAVLGAVAVTTLAAAAARLRARAVESVARFASVLYSIDASVVTRPLPVCDATPRSVTVLRESGANPALTPDDRYVFFDAPSADDGGRRQIHRLDRSDGAVVCWTCGDPGN